MEEKIYDRQVTKQSLSFRVVDQQQIERHFTTTELAELYTFEPELLDDTSGKKRKSATPLLPKVKKKNTPVYGTYRSDPINCTPMFGEDVLLKYVVTIA